MIDRLKKILLSIRLFSRLVVQLSLHPYQVEAANAVIDSCLRGKGLEFLWVFPRQSGKDETIAQLVVFLLTLFHRVEASIIHVYPTGNQIATGLTRLENRLGNLWTSGRWWTKAKPTRRGLGLAQCTFFSGHPSAKAEGATANLLLIINEVQDQDETVIERRFTPMRASTNATALYVGTVRTTADTLWKIKERLEREQASDGIRRVFVIGPDEVGEANPDYRAFMARQVKSKGRQHPIVKSELFNEPVDMAVGLFSERRRALMLGTHRRIRWPVMGEIYIALVDVGGQDEAATAAFAALNNPGRDYTVCTIVRAKRSPLNSTPRGGGAIVGPVYEVVDVFVDQGGRHFQDVPGQPSLFQRLLAYLEHWKVVMVVSDMTGVGQGLTDALRAAEGYSGRVYGFDFSKNFNKARLGNDFLAVIETGRFKYFADGAYGSSPLLAPPSGGEEGSEGWWFFTQAERCGYELAEGVPIERGLRWGVNPSAKVNVNGERVSVHDDRLLSAALVAEADRLYRAGEWFLSTGESAVIRRSIENDERWS